MLEVETPAEIYDNTYNPPEKDKKIVREIYSDLEGMWDLRNRTWPEFNDRTLKQFIDDCTKRLNSYVEDKAAAGKDDWQANVALPTIREKLKRMIAGFSLQVPDMEMRAYGENNQLDVDRAEIASSLIRGSYVQEENPVVENFWEAWEAGSKGTVIKYEGYLRTRYSQRFIKSFDYVTGEVEFDEKEVDVDDQCVSIQVPLVELLVGDFRLQDIQDQPSIAWAKYYTKSEFKREFGQYPKAEYVETKAVLSPQEPEDFFYSRWSDRVKDEELIEVIRYYNKYEDRYAVVANGLLLLDAPLLWEVNGKKVYPFAKTIFEPFEGKDFFYGNSLANVLMGQYDIINTLWNTLMDKEFRNLVKPLLLGTENQDAFELEDEYVTQSTKIYVDDVDQVKPMPIDGVNNADIQMLQLVARGLEEAAPSMPNLLSKKRTTAREVVVAEEKMKELKVIHQAMLADLWRQKYYLRLSNIKLHYPQPRKVINDEGEEEEQNRVFMIPNSVLDQASDERGMLAVEFTDIDDENRRELEADASAEEKMMEEQGVNYKKLFINRDFLDNRNYFIEVVPELLHKTSIARKQSTALEKIGTIRKLFPQMFVVNKKELYAELADAYGEDPGPAIAKMEQLQKQMQRAQQGGAPQGGRLQPKQPQQ